MSNFYIRIRRKSTVFKDYVTSHCMSLHMFDGHRYCSWKDNISPFRIHPLNDFKHDLSQYGYCFIVHNANSFFEEIEFVCKNTEFDAKTDFNKLYIYYGQTLYITHKQDVFHKYIDTIRENIARYPYSSKIIVYVPKPSSDRI